MNDCLKTLNKICTYKWHIFIECCKLGFIWKGIIYGIKLYPSRYIEQKNDKHQIERYTRFIEVKQDEISRMIGVNKNNPEYFFCVNAYNCKSYYYNSFKVMSDIIRSNMHLDEKHKGKYSNR